jgi:hypothetical protein
MVEKENPKPNISEVRRKRKIPLITQNLISALNKDGGSARVLANYTYTPEELAKLGGGDYKEGAKRVLHEIIKSLSDKERVERPLQEELDTAEPTDFGIFPKSTRSN